MTPVLLLLAAGLAGAWESDSQCREFYRAHPTVCCATHCDESVPTVRGPYIPPVPLMQPDYTSPAYSTTLYLVPCSAAGCGLRAAVVGIEDGLECGATAYEAGGSGYYIRGTCPTGMTATVWEEYWPKGKWTPELH